MSNQVKDGKKSLDKIAEEMKEEKLNVEKLKKVQKIMKLIYKEVKEKFLKGEEYKILDFPKNIFFDGENITFSEMKFPKLNFCGTEVYMDNYYSRVPSEKKTKDEIFAFRFAQAISCKFGYTKDNPYEKKVSAFNKARDNKISEIILQLELGAKKEELEQMLSNISIEV